MSTRPVIVFMGCPHLLDSDSRVVFVVRFESSRDSRRHRRGGSPSTRPTAEDLEALRLTEPLGIALLARACERYANRVCFRMREHAITYAALWDRVVVLASGLQHSGLVSAGDLVGIRGFSSVVIGSLPISPVRTSAPFACRFRAEAKIRICLMWSMKPI